MKQITCITCPIGCRITVDTVDGSFSFSGNRCRQGADFARAEMSAPLRTLTTTVKTVFSDMPALPVRTRGEVPKEKIWEIIRELSILVIRERVGIGDTVAAGIAGTGCDIIATGEMKSGKTGEEVNVKTV